jgi:hypothetical protein
MATAPPAIAEENPGECVLAFDQGAGRTPRGVGSSASVEIGELANPHYS